MTMCEPQSGGEILCIRLSGLGDVVHTMNALSLLHEYRPNARITWVVEERFADLLKGHPYIDELLTVPRRTWSRHLKNPLHWGQVVPEIADLVLELRRRKYDVSLDFQSSIKSAWLVAAAGADLRVGFNRPVARELSHVVQNELVDVPQRGCHRIERNLALLGALGIPTEYAEPVFPVEENYAKTVDWVTEELPRPLILMHPGTSDFASFKRWDPEHYGRVAERLMDERGAGVLVTFGPGEEALAHRLVAASAHRAVLAPRLAHLQQLTHILSKADLFVGSDTGPMHLSSGLGVPVVSLFGPKDATGTGPYCSRSRVVTASVECRPCDKRTCDDPVCMSQITEDDVYESCVDLLEGGGDVIGADSKPMGGSFTVDFELGLWEGSICTTYSSPGFYRFLSELGGSLPERERTFEGKGRNGADLVARVVRTGKGFTRKIEWGGLGNHWEKSISMQRDGLPVASPVCYMKRPGVELLLFEREGEWQDIHGVTADSANGTLAHQIAEVLSALHAKGYYHRRLDTWGSICCDKKNKIKVDNLQESWDVWLPLFLRELMEGMDLRGLLRLSVTHTSNLDTKDVMEQYIGLRNASSLQKRIISESAGIDTVEEKAGK